MRQYCIFSKEALTKMNGIRGKLATQAGHAYVHSFWDALERYPKYAKEFRKGIARKITVVVDTDEELRTLFDAYVDKCGVAMVIDRGLTVFKEPTKTCIGIGPIPDDLIGDDLKNLKTLT